MYYLYATSIQRRLADSFIGQILAYQIIIIVAAARKYPRGYAGTRRLLRIFFFFYLEILL